MIGPVSGTGRAMMASLQQAIQKGMPPDQAVQYVKSMATQGVAPLTDLYAMLNQFQRLKQQPVQAPQTPPTIRDQLNMMEQQQAMMQQGVASLPAPVMDQAQFAGGGIVAFANRGLVEDDVGEEIARLEEALRADDYIKQGLGGSFGRAVATKTMPMGYAQRLEAEKRLARLKSTAGSGTTKEPDFAPSGPPVKPDFVLPSGYGLPQQPAEQGATPDIFARASTPAAPPPAPPRDDTTPRVPAPRRPVAGSPVPAAPRTAPVEKERTLAELRAEELAGREAYKKEKGIGSADRELLSFLSDENNRLAEQFGRNKMFAFAEAGFKMAAAASRPGATFLGALSEGAISGTQALQGLQREMDANRRGLKEAMLKLRKADELEQMGDYDKAGVLAQQARTELFERKKHADSMNMDERRLQAVIEGNRLQYAAATARGQPGALGADDVARNQLSVLNDRAAAARKIMSDYQMLVTPPTPEQKRAYAEAQREYADAERLRSQLTGLPYSGGPVTGTSAMPSDIAALIKQYTGQGG